MNPLVTFVVPCYKLAHLLPQCVNSILEQDFTDFEVLIMDNCSPDQTPEVARGFDDPRVKHIRNESNLGHIRNFNKGISLAAGKYVWVVSADDALRSPHVLGRFVDVMERNPRVGCVFCRAMELHEAIETGIALWADCGEADRIWSDDSFLVRLIEINCIAASSVLVRKECYDKVGMFQVDLPFACDWYLWCMLAMHYDVAYLAEPMVYCRFHENSLTTSNFREHTRICVADELDVVWRVERQAELAGLVALGSECEAAFVRRAVRLLMAPLFAVTPAMSATDFEEILQNRIQQLNAITKIRERVYTTVAEKAMELLYRDDPPMPVADELAVLWSLRHHAKLASVPSLRAASESVIVNRAVQLLTAGLQEKAPGMSEAAFEAILETFTQDSGDTVDVRACVYTTVADQQYCGGEFHKANRSYWLALKARPWRPRTWTKYLLLRMGIAGTWIRQLAH
jgi:Glycosyl transferase family 2